MRSLMSILIGERHLLYPQHTLSVKITNLKEVPTNHAEHTSKEQCRSGSGSSFKNIAGPEPQPGS